MTTPVRAAIIAVSPNILSDQQHLERVRSRSRSRADDPQSFSPSPAQDMTLAPGSSAPFTDAIHIGSALMREALDRVTRFRITICVSLTDPLPREYFMRGTLESVTLRANLLFSNPDLLTIEPVSGEGESCDRRLTTISSGEAT